MKKRGDLTSLALYLGFSSSQHFAARFRRETGKPKFGSWIMGLAAKDAKIAKNM